MKKTYFILFFVFFISCKKTDNFQEKKTINDRVNEQIPDGWKIYTDGNIKAAIPSGWIPKKKLDMLFLVPIDKKLNIYYVVLQHKVTKEMSTKNYLREIIKQISEGTKEVNYSLRKIDFTNGNVCYLLEFFTTENNHKYKTYDLIYPKEKIVYDFGFKTIDDKNTNSINEKIFYNLLLTFKHRNKKVIDGENFIVKNAKEITYENL
jgi:hypothetical protein